MVGASALAQNGNFVEPTVFYDVEGEMAIARDEVFGPVQVILKFKTLEEEGDGWGWTLDPVEGGG